MKNTRLLLVVKRRATAVLASNARISTAHDATDRTILEERINCLRQLFSRSRVYNDLSGEICEHLEEKIEE
jgi:hypothetical protein